MELRVIFSPEAAADLFNLYEYIARRSGLASAAMNRANSAGEAGGTASEQTLTQLITCLRRALEDPG